MTRLGLPTRAGAAVVMATGAVGLIGIGAGVSVADHVAVRHARTSGVGVQPPPARRPARSVLPSGQPSAALCAAGLAMLAGAARIARPSSRPSARPSDTEAGSGAEPRLRLVRAP